MITSLILTLICQLYHNITDYFRLHPFYSSPNTPHPTVPLANIPLFSVEDKVLMCTVHSLPQSASSGVGSATASAMSNDWSVWKHKGPAIITNLDQCRRNILASEPSISFAKAADGGSHSSTLPCTHFYSVINILHTKPKGQSEKNRKAKKQKLRYKKDSDYFFWPWNQAPSPSHPQIIIQLQGHRHQKGYNTAVDFRKEMVGLDYE